MKRTAPKSTAEYLRSLGPKQRAALQRVRRIVRASLPGSEEGISYAMPAVKLNGRWIAGYCAFGKHCSFFPGAAPIAACKADLKAFKTSKGTIQFTPEKPLPAKLIRKLVAARRTERG
jgi:uncharacterized protein YdhG (YjbR/CyaY superfamily)